MIGVMRRLFLACKQMPLPCGHSASSAKGRRRINAVLREAVGQGRSV